MSAYLESLGANASVGDVFNDLYGQVDATITAFDDLRTRDSRNNCTYNHAPGTELYFSWSSVAEMNGAKIGKGQYDSTGLATWVDDSRYGLVNKRTFTAKPGAAKVPQSVSGYRARELRGDYALSQEKSGPIEVRLGKFGLLNTVETVGNELIGTAIFEPGQKITRLTVLDYRRLVAVSDGILDNLAAAGLIGAGEHPEEVFSAMGTPVRKLVSVIM